MVLVLGDIHGAFRNLLDKLDFLRVRHCTIICVGDVGIGFFKDEKKRIAILNEEFKKRRVEFLACRGNHDDPAFFNGGVSLENFKLLPDYTRLSLTNGSGREEGYLFIGGAVSIDRKVLVENESWWPGEGLAYNEDKLSKTDVLITHTIPTYVGPSLKKPSIVNKYAKEDPRLLSDCRNERRLMDKIVEKTRPTFHYAGHFHNSFIENINGCRHQVLDIDELVEHK